MDRFIQYTGTGEVSFSLVATPGDCNTLLSTLIQKYCDIQTLIWTNKVPQNLSNTTRGFTEYEKYIYGNRENDKNVARIAKLPY